MANLVAMNIKRKDAEVASHGFTIFLDPKRIKLQDASVIPEMMEEEKPLAYDEIAGAPPASVHPTMSMPSLSSPTQGREEAARGIIITMSTDSGSKSSEPPLAADQAAPMEMDIEDDVQQPQPGQRPQFRSDEFLLIGISKSRNKALTAMSGAAAVYDSLQLFSTFSVSVKLY